MSASESGFKGVGGYITSTDITMYDVSVMKAFQSLCQALEDSQDFKLIQRGILFGRLSEVASVNCILHSQGKIHLKDSLQKKRLAFRLYVGIACP